MSATMTVEQGTDTVINTATVSTAQPVEQGGATPPAPETAATEAIAPAAAGEAAGAAPAAAPRLPAGTVILGYDVSYNVERAEPIAREALRALLTEHGFADALPSRPPTAKTALRRAIYAWARGRAKGEQFRDDADRGEMTRQKQLIREIREQAERGEATPVVFALVEEASLGTSLALKYATAYRFHYRPASADATGVTNEGTLRVSSQGRGSMEDRAAREEERAAVDTAIRALWEQERDRYSGGDLAKIVIGSIHGAQGISVEAGSGVYFLPAVKADVVDRLERLVRALAARGPGSNAHIRVRENINWPRTVEALQGAAREALEADLRAADARLQGFEDNNAARPGSVRDGTVKGLIGELVALKEKAALYGDVVGLRQQRVAAELDALANRSFAIFTANRDARIARGTGSAPAIVAVGDGQRAARGTA